MDSEILMNMLLSGLEKNDDNAIKTIFLYVHIVKLENGEKKYYVGQSVNPEKRWNDGKGYSNNPDFYDDIIKYGWKNIEHRIVGIAYNQNDIDYIEAGAISYLFSLTDKYGYNRKLIKLPKNHSKYAELSLGMIKKMFADDHNKIVEELVGKLTNICEVLTKN